MPLQQLTEPEKIALKNKLKQWGFDLISERIAAAKAAMTQAQEAANSEEKSSAGDKYETGRAMGHLQKDMHARQLAESVRELATLHAVSIERLYSEGAAGAFLQTEEMAFFVLTGLGKQHIGNRTVFF